MHAVHFRSPCCNNPLPVPLQKSINCCFVYNELICYYGIERRTKASNKSQTNFNKRGWRGTNTHVTLHLLNVS